MLVPLTALVSFTLIGCIFAISIVKRTGRVLCFQFLVVVNYVAINLLSGIVHILNLGSRRGFYDAVSALEPRQLGQLILIQCLGLVSLLAGLLSGIPPPDKQQISVVRKLSRFDQVLLPLASVIAMPLALMAILRVREYASTLAVFGGRVIALEGGMARYFLVSHWLVWAIGFSVIWFAYGPFRTSTRFVLALTIVGIAVIAASLDWTGGRSISLVFALPLLMVLLPLLRRNKVLSAVFGGFGAGALLLYVVQLSSERSAASRLGAGNIADWLDWEWGRFSMLGFGVRYVDENGHLFGETLLGSMGTVLGFLFTDPKGSRSAAEIAGAEIYSSSSARFISPGLSFELYVNLGILGVLAGYFLVGWACKRIDRGFLASDSVVSQLLWSYLGTLVVFRVLPGEPFIMVQFLLYSGAPLVGVALVSHLVSRRAYAHSRMQFQSGEIPEAAVAGRQRFS